MDALAHCREINAGDGLQPRVPHFISVRLPRVRKFVKFCLVGASGVVADMGVLFLLADPRMSGLDITLSKIIAAEVAMINNFIWHELWTFGKSTLRPEEEGKPNGRLLSSYPRHLLKLKDISSIFRRFLLFNVICGAGVGLAVLLLHLFHHGFGLNLHLSNLLAIVLVTFWNFSMNAKWNWQIQKQRATDLPQPGPQP